MRHATLLFAALLSLQGWAQNICDGLNAAFTWASATATGNPVQFSNGTTGTGQQTNWLWDFGDGTTSNEAQPLHEFPGPGTYEVCLTAITVFILPSGEALTCVDEHCAAVVVQGDNNCSWLNASFTWAAGNNGVEFHYQPSGPTGVQYTYLWSFGDGSTANTQNAFHSYAANGTYEVCLTVTAYTTNSSSPCTATSCQAVTTSSTGNACAGLNAAFTWASATATGNPVQFSNGTTGTGQQTNWLWDFGDGTTSSEAQPLHEFPGPGTYEVCLTAITVYILSSGEALTCVDEYCAALVIGGGGNICDEFEASFSWTTTTSGNGVIFSNATTGTGFQTTWQWYFGDGTTSTEAQPDHAYTEPGTYTVCLVATTVFETLAGLITCVDEHCAAVVVQGANNCSWLNASFTWAAGNNGVEFHYQPSGPTGVQYTYLWSFGDGSTANTQNAFHSYAANGTYEVCLTVTAYTTNSSSPCTATSCQAVTTSSTGNACAGLNAAFTWASATATGNPVQFSNGTTGTGQQTNWLWDFGDGTTSSEAQPLHEFPGPGTYEVCLTAITVFISPNAPALTCVDDICASVVVAGDPQACDPSFALEIGSEATNAGFVLSASTNIPNSGVTWTFANGLVLYGPTIQVGLLSVLNIELCVTAWYQPANSSDTCWTEVCGLLSELGFAVGVEGMAIPAFRAWPNPAVDALYVEGFSTGPLRVAIHGADGRVEREVVVSGQPARVDLSGLAAGLKWVTLTTEERTERFTLVKE